MPINQNGFSISRDYKTDPLVCRFCFGNSWYWFFFTDKTEKELKNNDEVFFVIYNRRIIACLIFRNGLPSCAVAEDWNEEGLLSFMFQWTVRELEKRGIAFPCCR